MQDDVRARKRGVEPLDPRVPRLRNVGGYDRERSAAERADEVVWIPGAEIIDPHNAPSVAQEPVAEMRADEAGSAGDVCE